MLITNYHAANEPVAEKVDMMWRTLTEKRRIINRHGENVMMTIAVMIVGITTENVTKTAGIHDQFTSVAGVYIR